MHKSMLASLLYGFVLFSSTSAIDRYNAELLLQKYNYISASWQEYGRNATEEEYTQAVKDLQFTANLSQTGLLDNATEQRLLAPRCGRSDVVPYLHSETGLSKRNLTYRIVRYHSRHSTLQPIRQTIADAFRFWEELTPLRFQEQFQGPEVDITIAFDTAYDDSLTFDNKGGVIAYARYPGEINEGQIHFDDREEWSFSGDGPAEGGAINLYKVAVHEVGHVLGLRHFANPNSAMFAWFPEGNVALPAEERATLNKLYPSEDSIETTMTSMTAPVPVGGLSCPESVDAVLVAQQKTFIFSKNRFWCVDANGVVIERNSSIHTFWYGLPVNLTKIDAVYYSQRPEQRIIFFIGSKYYAFQSNSRHPGTPESGRPIADYCLPSSVKKVDAVFTWEHNQMTYIISDNMYWRIEGEKNLQECPTNPTYPRDMISWRGVQLPVDAAFTSLNKELYFFHKKFYWRFNDTSMSVNEEQPMMISDWLNCFPHPPSGNGKTTTDSLDVNSAPSLGACLVLACAPILAIIPYHL